ncbi:RidA family protein [Nonomuraea sediminis]|uniref:RidA family protein n=1 Tax=Nonomuraea sediminis TaxID=2835864 RepID=UPI001BDDC8EF|nr:RidA family protein [Nonomuraea sediminis]
MAKQWVDLPEDFGTLGVPVPFCNAVRSGDLVFVTGQTGDGADHDSAENDLVDVLKAAGAGPADVVRLNGYHVGGEPWVPRRFPRGTPYTSMDVTDLMTPSLLVEVDAIAVVGVRKAYSPRGGVRAGDMIFVEGKTDVRHPGDAAAQTRAILGNIAITLEELGGTLADVVKTTVYLADEGDWAETARVRSQLLGHGVATTDVVARALPPGALIQIEAVAMVDTPTTFADPPGVTAWPEPTAFHAGVRAGDLVFVSGQVALGVERDMAAQTRVVMDNLRAVLAELGASTDDVLRKNTYYVGLDPDAWIQAAPIRAEYFTKGPCATGVGVAGLVSPGLLICAEAVAMVDR